MKPAIAVLGAGRTDAGSSKSRRPSLAIILSALLIFSLGSPSRTSAGQATRGRVKAWGSNGSGQLGNGGTDPEHSPIFVPNLDNVKNLDSGCQHVLALKRNGTVRAWGSNNDGQLGNDDAPNNSPIPVAVSGLDNVKAVSAGGSHSLALKTNGTVRAWGSDDDGELGNNSPLNARPVPIKVDDLNHVRAIAAGQNVSYALKLNGTVWSWGLNDSGQLGNSDMPNNSPVPVKVKKLDNVNTIATNCSGFHALAVKKNGTVWAWGYGGDGVLGNGSTDNSDVPVRVSLLDEVKDVSGGYIFSLALKKNGTVWSWGENGDGALGTGNEDDSYVPVRVKNLRRVKEIAAGGSHGLAIRRNGEVKAWGWNIAGQLGDGSTDTRYLPVKVQNLTDVKHIASGASTSYAVKN